MPTPVATSEPVIVTAATGLLGTLWAADLRGLPTPFSVRVWESGRIELQFKTRDEVVTWAEAMDVDLDSEVPNLRASGELLDVPITVCAWVPEEVAP